MSVSRRRAAIRPSYLGLFDLLHLNRDESASRGWLGSVSNSDHHDELRDRFFSY